jgi:diamine N-acetyltransferase
MLIRRTSLDDLCQMSRLSESAFRHAYAWYNTPEDMNRYVRDHFSEEQLRKEFLDLDLLYFIAVENEEIAGYIKLNLRPEEFTDCGNRPLEIARLYTKVNLTGKGIGKKLVEESERFAKKNGFDSLCLGVWQKNEKAVKFYLREGFEIKGVTTFTLGADVQDDFVMLKRLRKCE